MVIRGSQSLDGEVRVTQNSDELTATQVTVGTTATLIAAANPNRKFIEIKNISAQAVFVGALSVLTTTGHSIEATTGRVTLSGAVSTAAIYGIVAATTSVVTVLEF